MRKIASTVFVLMMVFLADKFCYAADYSYVANEGGSSMTVNGLTDTGNVLPRQTITTTQPEALIAPVATVPAMTDIGIFVFIILAGVCSVWYYKRHYIDIHNA